jgi:glycosyltransferase involved in cell wall biosynthesis
MSNKSIEHIISLGVSSFPFGLAIIEKTKLIASSLIVSGAKVTVINRKWYNSFVDKNIIKLEGGFQGIDFCNVAGYKYRPSSFVIRNILRLIMPIKEFFKILIIHKKHKINSAIVSNRNAFLNIYYIIISKFFRFKLFITIVEHGESMVTRKHLKFKINDFIYRNFVLRNVDGVFPISEFLINYVKENAPKQQVLKIPIMCNFEKFNIIRNDDSEKYFMFCGGASYIELIQFILKAFEIIENKEYKVYLISNGTNDEITVLQKEISKNRKAKQIVLLSSLHERDLIMFYVNAQAMLIPLRNTDQDKGRFPHKIGEYLASANPIITTAIGEISYYFSHGLNALVAKKYDVEEFASLMEFVIDNPEEARKIGIAGKQMGLEQFDYSRYGEKILNFIKTTK